MANNLEISVITPSYNQCEFLTETIESVIGQEGDFHLDYIIVDGGSTDDSVEIIKRYAELLETGEWKTKCKRVRFRWFSEKDHGQADAIMKGFHLAEGEILAWLNSDDTYLGGTLARVVDVFKVNPQVMVAYGNSYYTNSSGEIIGQYPTAPFDFSQLAKFNYICQPSAFFRKNGFAAVGGLDVNLRFAMDYDLWVRLAKSFEFIYLQEFLATYRLHGKSKTVSESTALATDEETLHVAKKYFGWSPLNRVYTCSHSKIVNIYPSFLKKIKFPIVFSAILYCGFKYIYLNKGICPEDLRSINLKNIRKLFQDRTARYKES
jgi:glycosyltransferase involved in cell wall biosynthesis